MTQSCDDKVLFKEILTDFRDFSNSFLLFSRGHSLMLLPTFYYSNRWLAKYKNQRCEEFYRIKEPFKFLRAFINILVRIYLKKTIRVLDKINVSQCRQAYDLMSDFCSETNVDFFNQWFEKMRFMKNYFSDCFFNKNNSLDYIDLTI